MSLDAMIVLHPDGGTVLARSKEVRRRLEDHLFKIAEATEQRLNAGGRLALDIDAQAIADRIVSGG